MPVGPRASAPLIRRLLTFLAVVGLLSFISSLGDFVIAKVVLQDQDQFTLAVGMYMWAADERTAPWGIFAAGAVLAAVPVILQAGIIQEAGTQADIASACYVVAYQVGIAAGTWVGATGSDTLLPLTTALVTLGCSLLLLMRRDAAGSLTTTEECPA